MRANVVLLLSLAAAGAQQDSTDRYRKWLREDVVYIIAPEEKAVFEKLNSLEEKDNFIEQFWARRDPDPRTAANEFKEEHYRRIAYANDNFSSGFPGWQTDRGRVYIILGPPQSVERHPVGGRYQREISEGGGATATFPFEVWQYRHLPGLGNDVRIEFVDPTQSGEYRLALRPAEKDALLAIPGAGQTYGEAEGYETRQGRILSSLLMRNSGREGDPVRGRGLAGVSPFTRVEQYFKLQRPPSIQFKDLQASVDARIHYDQLPFQYRHDVFAVSMDKLLVPLTISLDMQDLSFREVAEGLREARVSVYGRVETIQRRIAYEFEDTVRSELRNRPAAGTTRYQRVLPLGSGRYKLHLVLKDETSGKLATREHLIVASLGPENELRLSSLVLADLVLAAAGQTLPDPFVTAGDLKVYPRVDLRFRESGPFGFYLEAYNLQVDASRLEPVVNVSYRIFDSAGNVAQEEDITKISANWVAGRLSIARFWKASKLAKGKYEITVRVADLLASRAAEAKARFEID